MTGFTSRKGAITVTWDDLQTAVDTSVLTAEQADQLWDVFAHRTSARPRFDAAHVAYYAGAVIVLSAMGWFITEAWESLNGFGVTLIALAYAAAFWMAGETLWKSGLTTPGGLLFTMAVWMMPLAIHGLERGLHLWPQGDPGSYRDYYEWVKGSWIVMELGTIAAGGLAIWLRPFPFLTFPIAFALWFMSMDLTPILFGKTEYHGTSESGSRSCSAWPSSPQRTSPTCGTACVRILPSGVISSESWRSGAGCLPWKVATRRRRPCTA